MLERVPRIILIVLACRCHLVIFFSRRHTYTPRVGVYHCLGRPRHSIVSMGVRRPRRCHSPRRSAVGSPRRPSSVASTDVGICLHRRCRRRPPPPRMRTRRTKDYHRWSANRRRRNQRCQLRAWSQQRGDRWIPLCAWRRQGQSPKRQEGQRNVISWPVVIIGLLGPGTELGIQTTKWD